jgi:hypothetical protein
VGRGTSVPSENTTNVPGGPFRTMGNLGTTADSRRTRVPAENSLSRGRLESGFIAG